MVKTHTTLLSSSSLPSSYHWNILLNTFFLVQGDRDLCGQFTTSQRIKACHTSNLPTKLVCSLLSVNTFLDIPNIQLDEKRFLQDSLNTLLPQRRLELISTNTLPPPSTQLTPTVKMFQDSLNTILYHSKLYKLIIIPPPSIQLKKSLVILAS